MKISGVWLPIITPFIDNKIDFQSYEKLIEHYISEGISGLIPLGTTGENPAVSESEFESIIDRTLATVDGRVPVFIGIGGNYTNKVLKTLKTVEKYRMDGILSVCPYYNRPGQQGLFEHFMRISEATDLKIIIYNIPYRTGVNLHNDTLFKLASQKNIAAVKDSCGDIRQSLALISSKPKDFSVLTGEDILFYTTVANGGDGGILASAHIDTSGFMEVYGLLKENNHQAALNRWQRLQKIIPLLFEESNPAPIKYVLKMLGLTSSAETRLPLTGISDDLKTRLQGICEQIKALL